jgi:hypothetical protein
MQCPRLKIANDLKDFEPIWLTDMYQKNGSRKRSMQVASGVLYINLQ